MQLVSILAVASVALLAIIIGLREKSVLRDGRDVDTELLLRHNTRVLITGSTSGLGKQAAQGFVKRGAQVVIHGPSAERTAKVAGEVQAFAMNGGKAIPIHADLSDFNEVRRMAKQAIEMLHQLDIVYVNAGYTYGPSLIYPNATKKLMSLPATHFVAKNGLDFVMTVNHYSHFLLMRELASGLAPQARVVILTGGGCWQASSQRVLKPGRIPWDHPGWRPHAYLAYHDSKFANVCYARALRRRLDGKATVIILDPGLVNTGMTLDRNTAAYKGAKYKNLVDKRWRWWQASIDMTEDFMVKVGFIKHESNPDMVSTYFFPQEVVSLIAGQSWEKKHITWQLALFVLG